MDDPAGPRLRLLLVVLLLLIVVGGTVDLVLDQPEQWLAFHPILELILIAGALLAVTTLWLGWWRAERSVAELQRSLAERREERDAWRESARTALKGFGEAVDRQFRTWGLTPAEREVGLLLLKGYSHKRVAKATDRSERTARQHAVAVYRKAGLSGRAELAAFFLDDVMLPDDGSPPGGRRPDDVASATRGSTRTAGTEEGEIPSR